MFHEAQMIYLRNIKVLISVPTANHHYFAIILNSVCISSCSHEIVHMFPSVLKPCDFGCLTKRCHPLACMPVLPTTNYINSIMSRNRGIRGNTKSKFIHGNMIKIIKRFQVYIIMIQLTIQMQKDNLLLPTISQPEFQKFQFLCFPIHQLQMVRLYNCPTLNRDGCKPHQLGCQSFYHRN